MHFFVIPRGTAWLVTPTFPCAVLEPDNWNDYGIRTLYRMTYYWTPGRAELLGEVKIMQRGRETTQLDAAFTRLGPEFCSLGQTLDYYRQLGRLGEEVFRPLLRALNDAVLMPSVRARFEVDPIFERSLLRFSEAQKALEVGREYLFSPERGSRPADERAFRFTFTTTVSGAAAPHVLPLDFTAGASGLHRIAVLVGPNGTGKTQVLAQFANAMSGRVEEATPPVSTFAPERPAFSRVMALSFSVFDDFDRPSEDRSFSYTYSGLRRANATATTPAPTEAGKAMPGAEGGQGGDSPRTRKAAQGAEPKAEPTPPPDAPETLLTAAEIRESLQRALTRIRSLKRGAEWRQAMTTVLGDDIDLGAVVQRGRLVPGGFERLSSGQRILVLVFSELVAGLEEEAIVLFDEPELYLHPNALSALTRALHELLEAFNCYAVLATHSPIVLQEVPARMVRVFDRHGDVPSVEPLDIESFGESLSTITDRVFEVTPASQNYRAYLARLRATYSVERILEMFGEPGLGLHARSYLRTLERGRTRTDEMPDGPAAPEPLRRSPRRPNTDA